MISSQSQYSVNGHGQYYTEGNHGGGIFVYDYVLQTFDHLAHSPTIVDYSCLTSYNDLLFVISGQDYNTVQVLDTSNSQWITDVPSLSYTRREAACAVDAHRGVAYVIAGGDYQIGWRSDIETLVIGNDPTKSVWITSQNTLNYATWGVRAIYNEYDDSILVFG
eukprot:709915_1